MGKSLKFMIFTMKKLCRDKLVNEILNEKRKKKRSERKDNDWDFIVIAVAEKLTSNTSCSHWSSFKYD